MTAENKEKYISFTTNAMANEYQDKGKTKERKVQLRFIDSFKFMNHSLDSLTNNLVKGGKKLTGFEDYSKDQYVLLVRKGVYPYEYMTSWDKFMETKLPLRKLFIVPLTFAILGRKITNMLRKYGKHSI